MNPQTQAQAELIPATNAKDELQRKHLKPVKWLLGRQLMGNIKGILLYTAYGKKLDPRDWMQARVFPKAVQAWREQYEAEARAQGRALPTTAPDTEFWFDYLADAGDGTRAMYSLAYLCMSNLWVRPLPDELPATAEARVVRQDNQQGATMELPRGAFLFIGGDTAYHASDYMTLASRVKQPFRWAYEDLVRHRRIKPGEPARPLFGIPGNHDYYDQLDGFRRQFHQPVKEEPPPEVETAGQKYAQLGIAGFYRAQAASYVALQLPFNCWLWGLDTEVGQIDDRQEKFFRDLCPKKPPTKADIPPDIIPPEKLIVATCSPTTAFGKIATEDDYKAADAIGQLGLRQPFLPDEKRDDGTYDLATSGDVKIDAGQCRLEISGDVHHYARYWGPAPKHGARPRTRAQAAAKEAHSYASVVSGLGGAFHHPSTTYNDEVQEQVLYPDEQTSRSAIAERIFKFWNIWGGGYVWLAGAIIAFVLYFAATVPQSSRQFISNILPQRLELLQQETITPTTYALPADFSASTMTIESALTKPACAPVAPFALWRTLGLVSAAYQPPQPCDPYTPHYFVTTHISEWPRDLLLGTLCILVSLVAVVLTFIYSNRIFGVKGAPSAGETETKPSEVTRVAGEKRIRRAKGDPEEGAEPRLRLWLIVILTSIFAFVGLATIEPYGAHFTPFVSSLLVLFSLTMAAGAAALSIRYSEYLFKRGHKHYIDEFEWALPQVLTGLSVLSIAFGLWSFGHNNLAALLTADILFSLVVVGTVLVILLPFKVGGELLQPARGLGWLAWLGKFLIGLWHVLLQLVVPFVLTRRGTVWTWGAAIVLVFLSMWLGEILLKRNSRLGLSLAWLVFGALMLALPYLTSSPGALPAVAQFQLFLSATLPVWLSWLAPFAPFLLAALMGAVLCCVWFGWYLGVCFAFNGHNNEVGGAARIENYKEFIRFRITAGGLTGYVIAVDDVSIIDKNVKDANGKARKGDGEDLKPRLIDVFHLTLKPAAGGAVKP